MNDQLLFSAFFADIDANKPYAEIKQFAKNFMRWAIKSSDGYGRADLFKTGNGWHVEFYIKDVRALTIEQAVTAFRDLEPAIDEDYCRRRIERGEFTLFWKRRGVMNRQWVMSLHHN